MTINLPNIFTLFRILILPVFVIIFYLPVHWSDILCAVLFAIAAFTDWIDGYLARKLNQETPFGAFFDPVADKLIVAVALVLLVGKHGTPWLAIPASVIICREIMVSALREWMAELGKRAHVAVSYIGKCKTALQMISIFVLLLTKKIDSFDNPLVMTGYVMVYLAAILTLWSMWLYLRAAWPSLTLTKDANS